MADAERALAQAILGASESIDVLGTLGFDSIAGLKLQDVAAIADRRLRMRWLLRDPVPETPFRSKPKELLRSLADSGWAVRTIQCSPTVNCVIVDREQAVMSVAATERRQTPVFVIDSTSRLYPVLEHFESLWSGADAAGKFNLLHEELLLPTIPEFESRLAAVSVDTWSPLIADLATSPDLLYSLNPRRFEELVAELLSRRGMKTTLTPATRDGGRDILAVSETDMGRHLYLVECKRYAKHRPVDVSIVRELYGVLTAERATAGLIVTTSYFTRDALTFRAGVQHQLGFKEYQDLVSWLKGTAR